MLLGFINAPILRAELFPTRHFCILSTLSAQPRNKNPLSLLTRPKRRSLEWT